MVFVTDTSVETTHYYVTVEYLSRNNSRVRVERLNEKTNPKGLTPVYLEAHDVTMVINITVIALKQTGHRSGIVGFGQAS